MSFGIEVNKAQATYLLVFLRIVNDMPAFLKMMKSADKVFHTISSS